MFLHMFLPSFPRSQYHFKAMSGTGIFQLSAHSSQLALLNVFLLFMLIEYIDILTRQINKQDWSGNCGCFNLVSPSTFSSSSTATDSWMLLYVDILWQRCICPSAKFCVILPVPWFLVFFFLNHFRIWRGPAKFDGIFDSVTCSILSLAGLLTGNT